MDFWTLFQAASAPVIQVLIVSLVGAFLASGYSNILTTKARKDMNKVVFVVFTPALIFANLSKTVTFEELMSWWFMPVNIGIIVFLGAFLSWVAVKILRLPPYLEKVTVSICSAGNFGNLLLILVPAVCNEYAVQFGNPITCAEHGLSYVAFSMALGGFYIWTYSYSLMKQAGDIFATMKSTEDLVCTGCGDLEGNDDAQHMNVGDVVENSYEPLLIPSTKPIDDTGDETVFPLLSSGKGAEGKKFLLRLKESLSHIIEELMTPPTLSAVLGFIFGAIPWLKFLLVGDHAPLRVIQDTLQLLGDGTIPCVTLILGGNLTNGLLKPTVKPTLILAIIFVKCIILPIIGIGIVKFADNMGFLPQDPLFLYVLMLQYTVPPAMYLVTITELFDVGQKETSVILLWTYLAAVPTLTMWSTVFLWMLS